MNGFLSKVIGPKKEWRAHSATRVWGARRRTSTSGGSLNHTVAAKLAE